jgi:membrane fusion protein (multidrug efflux system)
MKERLGNDARSLAKKALVVSSIFTLLLAAGCSKKPASAPPSVVEVKAIQVAVQDTPITYEFVGEVAAKEEVQLRARISGNLVEKMVTGGTVVQKGQPLFQIDGRQYNASLLNSQAQLAQAEASYSRIRRDLARYQTLASQQAVAQQSLDSIAAEERQSAAQVEAMRALVEQAAINMQDTVIVSPIDGRIDVADPSVGTYIQAGSTVLATISSLDPVYVKFSISENDYLRFTRLGLNAAEWGKSLKLYLSDGSQYPLEGKVEQIDRGLSQETASITVKAAFSNPNKLLLPKMFARVSFPGETRKGAMLIPQKAVQEMLGKTFVTVIGEGDKAETRNVKMGPRVGSNWIVEEGLTPGERVVVEGFLKVQPGMNVKVTLLGPDELKNPAQK